MFQRLDKNDFEKRPCGLAGSRESLKSVQSETRMSLRLQIGLTILSSTISDPVLYVVLLELTKTAFHDHEPYDMPVNVPIGCNLSIKCTVNSTCHD